MIQPKYRIITTQDGSHSVIDAHSTLSFHSTHGAVQESRWVYLEAGWHFYISHHAPSPVQVLEMGFGTGLNALLTWQAAQQAKRDVHYQALDLYPLPAAVYDALNYGRVLQDPNRYRQLMRATWNQEEVLEDGFSLMKKSIDLLKFEPKQKFDLVYFDAFAPEVQPEIWSRVVFEKIYGWMGLGGILVTYCSKSVVRKAMMAAGFRVEKLAGPRGKREILRAHV